MQFRSRLPDFALLLALFLGCGAPDFVVFVTFPGPVEVERGANVVYQGVVVGEVDAVSLVQRTPDEPAQVRVTVSISDPHVTLREGDRFQISSESMLGSHVLEIVPSEARSTPLRSGATVAGVPPVVTRMEETVESFVDSLSELADRALREALETLDRGSEPPAPETDQPANEPDASP
jgi:ABC-type transporter Mla subunit MlaD